jgi:hypothetical protein
MMPPHIPIQWRVLKRPTVNARGNDRSKRNLPSRIGRVRAGPEIPADDSIKYVQSGFQALTDLKTLSPSAYIGTTVPPVNAKRKEQR